MGSETQFHHFNSVQINPFPTCMDSTWTHLFILCVSEFQKGVENFQEL